MSKQVYASYSDHSDQDHSDDEHENYEVRSEKSSYSRRGPSRIENLPSIQDLKLKHGNMWKLMSTYLSPNVPDIQQFIVNHLEYTLARSRFNFDDSSTFQATALSLRDRMIEFWNDTQQYFTDRKVKRVYYLSIEFLMGRSMQNSVNNLGLMDAYSTALKDLGYKLEDLYEQEQDAALGNGGLGRLAACFLDSLATLDYPAWGYGIRYQYGIFKQDIVNGNQVEQPDFWLRKGNPWEICRLDVVYPIRFGGFVDTVRDYEGNERFIWDGGEVINAVAFDTPIPGYGTDNTLNLRLWSSAPCEEFDLKSFNEEDYYNALKARQVAQNLTSVLYPNDKTQKGKELRLKQQYFFCAASLRDIMRRFKKTHKPMSQFSSLAAIQLNDTHPVIAIPELMHLLVDQEEITWNEAWDIVKKTFSYTNHTVLPEALERWSVTLLQSLLPRHLQIIYEINRRHLLEVEEKWPGDTEKLRIMSIIEEGTPKMIRMANLAIVGSHCVNGVAEIHTSIIKETIFRPFYDMNPSQFQNKTNGVTPRRWIVNANPELANFLTSTLGNEAWIKNLPLISEISKYAQDEKFQARFASIKQTNKLKLKALISNLTNGELVINENALFDIQVKRIHEYKRQLLNILGIIARYQWIKGLSSKDRLKVVPRVCLFAGKAAPGYFAAKNIIKLINNVAKVVNHDAEIDDLLKIYFIPNYNVSLCEVLVPASDISQHISTAGTEASGTSNMKFCMNGGLILGTLDGANVEIREESGDEQMFIFGALASEVASIRAQGGAPLDQRLYKVKKALQENQFGEYSLFETTLNPIWQGNDYYLLAHDFPSYMKAQTEVDECFKDRKEWFKRCILTTSSMGKFSSDTTIHKYANEIWGVKPCPIPPTTNSEFHK